MDSAIKYKEGKGFRVNPFRLSDTLFIYMYKSNYKFKQL